MSEPLSPPLFAILVALVEERTGITYGRDDVEIFSSKVMASAVENGFESPLDYYYALRYDDPSHRNLDMLCEALVVNETYFFREIDPLNVLCDDVIAPMSARGERARVWSAAAATGEEPLTVAMLLEERGLRSAVDIVASDISVKALARAAAGSYGQRSFRATTAQRIERWFRRDGDRWVVNAALRESIDWRRINLMDGAAIALLEPFDVILCRNVLIYFGEDTIRRVVTHLTNALRPGGRLVVGASESLLRFGTQLRCEERGGCFFYVKAS